MLISAGRQALIITVEMVDDDGVAEKPRAGADTALEADQASQQRQRGAALHHWVLQIAFPPPKVKTRLTSKSEIGRFCPPFLLLWSVLRRLTCRRRSAARRGA